MTSMRWKIASVELSAGTARPMRPTTTISAVHATASTRFVAIPASDTMMSPRLKFR